MAQGLAVRLIEVINEEIRAFNDLLNLLKREQQAIVTNDLAGIEAAVGEKGQLAQRGAQLSQAREKLVAQVALELEVGEENPRLSRLIEVVDGQAGEELGQMRQALIDLTRKIGAANASNAYLLRQSMGYTERCLDIFSGNKARGLYGQFGKKRQRATSQALVNETA